MYGLLIPAVPVMAQQLDVVPIGEPQLSEDSATTLSSFRITPSTVLDQATPLISIARNREERDFNGTLVDDAVNLNLGLKLQPVDGFNLQADAWSLRVDQAPAATSNSALLQDDSPRLYIQESAINEFNLDSPLIGSSLESNGFDLGASYEWNTNRFGKFTLSTKTTYVKEFENKGALLEIGSNELNALGERLVSPELQSSIMLSWQFGNHNASAITNYFDSFKDITELDVDAINDLVENITTVDLQYDYSVKTGSRDRAIISFGIRNIFNEKTAQILNSTTRILDQNGRVAYGSVKYQF